MSRIVLAPDSFKGSASAQRVSEALAAGWRAVRPTDEVLTTPMADGGEGTLAAFAAAYPLARSMPVTVTGPDDRPVSSSWLLLPDGTGVVELAATCGLTLLDRPRPLSAHSRGFGEAIAHTLDHGVQRLLLAIGGSASTDGGAGVLTALGAQLLDRAGRPIPPGGAGLVDLAAVDLSGLRPLPPGGALVLSDVTNPLLGPEGAARVFGPQKGAQGADLDLLEAGLERLVALNLPAPDGSGPLSGATAGAGAAGGVGFALHLWGARPAGGADGVGAALHLPEQVRAADLVVTGEGRFDQQTARGKLPSYVLGLARQAGVPVALVAGQITAPTDGFAHALALTTLAGSPDAARSEPERWLRRSGAALAAWFDGSPPR